MHRDFTCPRRRQVCTKRLILSGLHQLRDAKNVDFIDYQFFVIKDLLISSVSVRTSTSRWNKLGARRVEEIRIWGQVWVGGWHGRCINFQDLSSRAPPPNPSVTVASK